MSQGACECDAQLKAQRPDRVRHVALRALGFPEGCNLGKWQAPGAGRVDRVDRMLVASGTGSAADLQRAAAESQGLGLFVRSLVGLDRQAATASLKAIKAEIPSISGGSPTAFDLPTASSRFGLPQRATLKTGGRSEQAGIL